VARQAFDRDRRTSAGGGLYPPPVPSVYLTDVIVFAELFAGLRVTAIRHSPLVVGRTA